MKAKIISLILIALALSACANAKTNSRTSDFLDVDLVEINNAFDIHTDLQNEYLNNPEYSSVAQYTDCTKELTHANNLTLKWVNNGPKVSSYTISVSENEDMSSPWLFTSKKTQVNITNLKLNTRYYWNVSAEVDGKMLTSGETGTFQTKDGYLRNMDVNRVRNFRDLGGYKIDERTYLKQGLIYRSGRLSENYTGYNLLDENAQGILLNHIGIKTEIDLRRTDTLEYGNITESPIGKEVNYKLISCESTDGNPYILNNEQIKEFFKVLGNKDNYPLVFHCAIGTDRTGFCAFLIEALLGLSTEYMYRDYLFSNFSDIGSPRTGGTIERLIGYVNKYTGGTLKDRANAMALDLGIQQSQIDTIRELMLVTK